MIKENISLNTYTAFRVGGPARYFVEVTSVVELREAVLFAKEKRKNIFALGEGSNILVSDDGIDDVVLQIKIKGIEEKKDTGDKKVFAWAGKEWDGFVKEVVQRRFYGLENLSLIPGTVGAAPVQNIGAYGKEVGEYIESVLVFDTETMEEKILSNAECLFSYRDSLFKKTEGKKYVVLGVTFILSESAPPSFEYKDLVEYFTKKAIDKPTPEEVRAAVIEIRTVKLPSVSLLGTAGSFFKNPIITKDAYDTLLVKYSGMPHYLVSDLEVKVPLAWIIDHVLGLKGYIKGNVGLYKKQPLAIVNFGNATASEINNFAKEVEKKIFDATKIIVEREVQCVGKF